MKNMEQRRREAIVRYDSAIARYEGRVQDGLPVNLSPAQFDAKSRRLSEIREQTRAKLLA